MKYVGAAKGDRVRVSWSTGDTLEGVVHVVPEWAGDSWVIVHDDGGIFHVQQFERMVILNRVCDLEVQNDTLQGSPEAQRKEIP